MSPSPGPGAGCWGSPRGETLLQGAAWASCHQQGHRKRQQQMAYAPSAWVTLKTPPVWRSAGIPFASSVSGNGPNWQRPAHCARSPSSDCCALGQRTTTTSSEWLAGWSARLQKKAARIGSRCPEQRYNETQACWHPALHGKKGGCGDTPSAERSSSCGALRCHFSAGCCRQHCSWGSTTEHKGAPGQPCCYIRQQVQQQGCCSSCNSLISFTCYKQPGAFNFGMCIMISIFLNCCNRRCFSPAFPASHFQALGRGIQILCPAAAPAGASASKRSWPFFRPYSQSIFDNSSWNSTHPSPRGCGWQAGGGLLCSYGWMLSRNGSSEAVLKSLYWKEIWMAYFQQEVRGKSTWSIFGYFLHHGKSRRYRSALNNKV